MVTHEVLRDEHVEQAVGNLTPYSLAEVRKLEGDWAWHIKETAERSTRAWAILDGEVVVALIGVNTPGVFSQRAMVWMLATNDISLRFAIASRRLLKELLEIYPTLWGWLDPKFPNAVKWVKTLGGELSEQQVGDQTYYMFKLGEP